MFLRPLLREPARPWVLVHAESQAVVARRVQAAVDSRSRRKGLLGRDGLDDEALIIAPCNAVHTFFMRFPIDVIFTDREGVITRCVADVRPWRMTGALRGFATIEVAAGTIERTRVGRGQRLELRDAATTPGP
jgi:uncharacterized membrane protein (UPF0127 family)